MGDAHERQWNPSGVDQPLDVLAGCVIVPGVPDEVQRDRCRALSARISASSRKFPASVAKLVDQLGCGPDLIDENEHCDLFHIRSKNVIRKKQNQYGKAATGFDRLYLLVYYNEALLYNTPAEGLFVTFEDVAERVTVEHAQPFDEIFLFIAVNNGEAFRISRTNEQGRAKPGPMLCKG